VLDAPNAERSQWHLSLEQRLDWDRPFSAWRLGFFFYNMVGLSYANDLTYTLIRGGGCRRERLDAPFCSAERDQFEPDMYVRGVKLGLKVAF
jgi:hypothetical protein